MSSGPGDQPTDLSLRYEGTIYDGLTERVFTARQGADVLNITIKDDVFGDVDKLVSPSFFVHPGRLAGRSCK